VFLLAVVLCVEVVVAFVTLKESVSDDPAKIVADLGEKFRTNFEQNIWPCFECKILVSIISVLEICLFLPSIFL